MKKFPCDVIGLTIFHLSKGGVLLEKMYLEISQIHRKTHVAHEDFLYTSFHQKNEMKEVMKKL